MADDHEHEDELEPTTEELALMRQASAEATAAVDGLLLGKCGERWMKVANLIGSSLDEFERLVPEQPYVFMQLRLLALEEQGRIEIAGDVMRVRESEVRIAQEPNEA